MTQEEIEVIQARARELGEELCTVMAEADIANEQLREDVRISPEMANAPCTI